MSQLDNFLLFRFGNAIRIISFDGTLGFEIMGTFLSRRKK